MFVILSVLVAGCFGARLENTYIPPASAHSAGGYNLDTPKLAQASNAQQTYAAPAPHSQFQPQSHNQGGLNHGTFTSISRGGGYQSVQSGTHSANSQQPQQQYQQPQQQYQAQAPQASYPAPQQQYSNYNQASTTPIPILKCKTRKLDKLLWMLNVFSS